MLALHSTHILTPPPTGTPIQRLLVDLGSDDMCSGLRDKWADGRLFLKDMGPSDLVCTSGAKESRDETLLDTIVDNWQHLRHFREDADHMTKVEMRQWLWEWQASSEEGQVTDISFPLSLQSLSAKQCNEIVPQHIRYLLPIRGERIHNGLGLQTGFVIARLTLIDL